MSLNQHSTTTGVNDFSSGTSSGDLAKLELSDGTYLSTKLVVGADGSKSHVRELAGFKTTGWNYSQNAVICTVEHVVKLASERMVFPLSLKHTNDHVSKHIALVGDAAHTVHPLAGQGVNLGFGDALVLSRVIGEAIAVGVDIGEGSMLKKYEAERKMANLSMMAVLDGFQKLYKADLGPLNILRAAFSAAKYIPPLKINIISFASGEQQLPPLFT